MARSIPVAPTGLSTLEQAENDPVEYPYQPAGEWNTLKVWFMSARYEGRTLKKLATFSVKINQAGAYNTGAFVLNRIGIAVKTSGSRNGPGYFGRVTDDKYDLDYQMDIGPLVLQEHDNQVEFKNLKLDLTWKPTVQGGGFDDAWQQSPSS